MSQQSDDGRPQADDGTPQADREVPIRRSRPRHVSFLPWLVGMLFLVGIVVAGVIASDAARKRVTVTAASPGPAATLSPTAVAQCSPDNFIAAAKANPTVPKEIVDGGMTVPRFKCADGYAYVTYQPVKADQQSVRAWLELTDGQWKIRSLGGDVGDGSDVGVPKAVSSVLTASRGR